MTSKEYKNLSVSEFTKAAEVYQTDHTGVYNMCKKDYPCWKNSKKSRSLTCSTADYVCITKKRTVYPVF